MLQRRERGYSRVTVPEKLRQSLLESFSERLCASAMCGALLKTIINISQRVAVPHRVQRRGISDEARPFADT